VIKNMDVYRHISRLKMLRNMREEQVTALFKLFLDVIKTDDQITEVDGMSYFFFLQGDLMILTLS
jgi:uncharacterized tellurite resistance protein B-like protein